MEQFFFIAKVEQIGILCELGLFNLETEVCALEFSALSTARVHGALTSPLEAIRVLAFSLISCVWVEMLAGKFISIVVSLTFPDNLIQALFSGSRAPRSVHILMHVHNRRILVVTTSVQLTTRHPVFIQMWLNEFFTVSQ